jgi:hypothetical protein
MLNVIMLNVVLLNVLAPQDETITIQTTSLIYIFEVLSMPATYTLEYDLIYPLSGAPEGGFTGLGSVACTIKVIRS